MNLFKSQKLKPMLLKEIDKPFNSKEYLFELKFDGIRTIMFVSNNEFKIISRNGIDMTNIYPELKIIKSMFKKETIIDGEIIMMYNGKPSFSKLQERNHLRNKNRIEKESINNKVTFIAFDILYEGEDLTNLDLLKRKEILNKYKDNNVFVKSKIYLYEGIKLFKYVKKLGLEGIVAKRIDSKYEINTRSSNWIKIKNNKEETFVIGGYIIKKNDYLSLILGEYRNGLLYYVGNASLTKNLDLYDKVIKSKVIKKSPFIDYDKVGSLYIKPNIECEIKYLERTKSNHLRQPIIKRRKNAIKRI